MADTAETAPQPPTTQTTAPVAPPASTQAPAQQAVATNTSQPATAPEPPFNKDALLKDLYTERDKRKALQAELEQVKANAASLEEAKKSQAAVQRKYDRLEALLLKSGGSLASLLDSRTFAQQLFETDDPVEKLVDAWNKAHPSQTAQALGAKAGEDKAQGPSISEVLRAAINAAR